MQRIRGGTGRKAAELSGVQRLGHGDVRTGIVRSEPSLSGLRRPGANSGTGEVRTKRRISVTVPSGVESGSRLRVSGQGERGPGGGPSGDLIIKFRVKDDRFFERDGMNLVCEVPINVAQAMLGSRIRVRTIDKKKVVLRIPAGTQSGTTFRIRGHGVEKEGSRGDQLVRVVVETPDLSDAGRKAFEELADKEGLPH